MSFGDLIMVLCTSCANLDFEHIRQFDVVAAVQVFLRDLRFFCHQSANVYPSRGTGSALVDNSEQMVCGWSCNCIGRCINSWNIAPTDSNRCIRSKHQHPLVHGVGVGGEGRCIKMESNSIGCFRLKGNCKTGAILQIHIADGSDVWSSTVVSFVKVIGIVPLDAKVSGEKSTLKCVSKIRIAAAHENRAIRQHICSRVVETRNSSLWHHLETVVDWSEENRSKVRLSPKSPTRSSLWCSIDDKNLSCGQNQHVSHHSWWRHLDNQPLWICICDHKASAGLFCWQKLLSVCC